MEHFEEYDEEAPLDKGVLSHPPKYGSIVPIASVYVGIAICSILYWNYDYRLATSYDFVYKSEGWYSVFTALFVHSDIAHVLSNSPMLIIFGYYLHGYYGARTFPIACILLGALTNIICIHMMYPHTRLIGASGMVYAMVGIWLVYYVRFESRYRLTIRLLRATGFSIIVLFPSVYQENVSYLAHGVGLGLGLIFALATAFFIHPFIDESELESTTNVENPELLH